MYDQETDPNLCDLESPGDDLNCSVNKWTWSLRYSLCNWVFTQRFPRNLSNY